MFIGALVDSGVSFKELKSELSKLNLKGFEISVETVLKNQISSSKFMVDVEENIPRRGLKDILNILDKSELDAEIKNISKDMFLKLAEVESKIHNISVDKVHFHELGAIDTIVDIVGAIVGLKMLEVEKVYASPISIGKGFVETEHGMIPIPVPATLELLKGIPTCSSGIEDELVTPTGALILKYLVDEFGEMPPIMIENTGYGAGSKDFNIPNILRLIVGETRTLEVDTDEIVFIETNIDDITPEILSGTISKLQQKGALDVYTTPIYMKKNRLSFKLSVLSRNEDYQKLIDIIFRETPTIGVRFNRMQRYKLFRELIEVETVFGEAKVKIGWKGDEVINISPEYEDCMIISDKHDIPVTEVMDEVKRVAFDKISKDRDTQ
jgi:hypothetical protein